MRWPRLRLSWSLDVELNGPDDEVDEDRGEERDDERPPLGFAPGGDS